LNPLARRLADRHEERLRRLVPGEPAPPPALIGLADDWLADRLVDLDEQRPVAQPLWEIVLRLADHARLDRLDAGFFVELAQRAGLDALGAVEMAAGNDQLPAPCAPRRMPKRTSSPRMTITPTPIDCCSITTRPAALSAAGLASLAADSPPSA
jgi:hypothetical protein